MTRYNARELAETDPELWEYLAPNSRKWHVYDKDGDSLCRRYVVLGGSFVFVDGPFSYDEVAITDELCAGCTKTIEKAKGMLK